MWRKALSSFEQPIQFAGFERFGIHVVAQLGLYRNQTTFKRPDSQSEGGDLDRLGLDKGLQGSELFVSHGPI